VQTESQFLGLDCNRGLNLRGRRFLARPLRTYFSATHFEEFVVKEGVMRFTVPTFLLVGLTGCAAPPIQSPQQAAPPAPTVLQVMISTCDLSVRPELQALTGKFPLSLNQIQQPGLSLLSTDRGPTTEEQAALASYDQLHRSCVRAQANWFLDATLGTMPEATSLQQKMFASEENHLVALFQGKETFAQFTRAVNALHANFMSDTTRMAQGAYDKTQEQIRSSAPVRTDCQTYYGGSTTCVTR